VFEEIERRFAASRVHQGFGMVLDRVEEGRVDVGLELGPDHLNLQGTAHGGVLATLADTAMGIAYRTVLEPRMIHLTSSLQIAFLTAGRPGRIVASGVVVKRGRRFGYAEADVRDAKGTLLARATATFVVMRGDAVSTRRPSPT
jgi:uncharacterized protein (TIGR00369 family)